jgi:hypothetical protein
VRWVPFFSLWNDSASFSASNPCGDLRDVKRAGSVSISRLLWSAQRSTIDGQRFPGFQRARSRPKSDAIIAADEIMSIREDTSIEELVIRDRLFVVWRKLRHEPWFHSSSRAGT